MANKEERTNLAIRITKKYMSGNYYAFGSNADIFELFEIDTTQSNEMIKEKIVTIRKSFHEDLVHSMPDKYRYAYLYISRNLVPQLEVRTNKPYSTYIADKKDSINKYRKEIDSKYPTPEAKEKFFQESISKLNEEILNYNRAEEDKKRNETNRPTLNKLDKLIIHYIGLNDEERKDAYKVFRIPKDISYEELIQHDNYTSLIVMFGLGYNMYEQLFNPNELQKKAYNDIKNLYMKCKSSYFSSPSAKDRYDKSLVTKEFDETKTLDLDEIMVEVIRCSQNMYNAKTKLDNYFQVFDFDMNYNNKQILSTYRYRLLSKIFTDSNLDIIPDSHKEAFKELLKLFKDFDKNVLHNDMGRESYINLLNTHQEYKTNPNTKPQQDKYEFTINAIINSYRVMYQNSPFINYYDLFRLPMDMPLDKLKQLNNYKFMKECFNKTYENRLSDPSDRIAYQDLCSMFDNFSNITLSNEVRKKSYDEKVKQYSKNDSRIKYTPLYAKESARFDSISDIYNKEIQSLILTIGVTKALAMIITSLEKNTFDNLGNTSYLTNYKPKQILNYLKSTYGRLKPNKELVLNSFNQFITKKLDILKEASIRTYEKYDINQLKKALEMYISENNSQYFTSGNNNAIGRGRLVRDVPPELIKIILGCVQQQELGFLIDDVENKYSIADNPEAIDMLVESLLNERLNNQKGPQKH